MSIAPIFKLPKINFGSTKQRKDFILDMMFVGIGLSILHIAVHEKFTEGVKIIHKNKYRKNIKKIEEVLTFLDKRKNIIYSMLDMKDLKTIQHKMHEKASMAFIKHISQANQNVCLEYLAISMLEQGIKRASRKSDVNEYLKPFYDIEILYKKIGLNVEKTGYVIDHEYDLASKFIKAVRY